MPRGSGGESSSASGESCQKPRADERAKRARPGAAAQSRHATSALPAAHLVLEDVQGHRVFAVVLAAPRDALGCTEARRCLPRRRRWRSPTRRGGTGAGTHPRASGAPHPARRTRRLVASPLAASPWGRDRGWGSTRTAVGAAGGTACGSAGEGPGAAVRERGDGVGWDGVRRNGTRWDGMR